MKNADWVDIQATTAYPPFHGCCPGCRRELGMTHSDRYIHPSEIVLRLPGTKWSCVACITEDLRRAVIERQREHERPSRSRGARMASNPHASVAAGGAR